MFRVTVLLLTLAGAAAEALAQEPVIVRGRVLSETGVPIGGARVTGPLPAQLLARTDAGGRFEISVRESRLEVTILKSGFAREMVRRSPVPRDIEIRLKRGAALTVHVIGQTGEPVAGARVRLRCGSWGSGGESDDAGQMRLAYLPPGRCTVEMDTVGPFLRITGEPSAAQIRAAFESLRKQVPAAIERSRNGGIAVDLSAGEEAALVMLGTSTQPSPLVSIAGRATGPTGSGSISGRITSQDGRPLEGARVSLTGPSPQMVLSDASGTFAFTRLPAGTFRLRAMKPGYAMGEFGQGPSGGGGRDVTLLQGQQLQSVDLALLKGSAVAGTITDERGEPVEDATVRVVEADPAARTGGPTMTGARRTDDRGRYRVPALLPGTYYVSTSVGGPGTVGDTVYYPGRSTIVDAVPVKVVAGQDLVAVDIAVGRAVGAVIRGRVVDSTGAARSGSVRLSGGDIPAIAPIAADGQFELTNVPPGEHVLHVTASPPPFAIVTRRGGLPVDASPIPSVEYARVALTVGSATPTSVNVRTSEGSSLIGAVVFEGGRPGVSPLGMRIGADAYPAVVPVAADWTFELRGLIGASRIALFNPPAGWWLKSVLVGGVNAADEPVTFAAGDLAQGANAVLARTSRIAGRVLDERGAVASDFRVVAFPVDRARWFAGSRYVQSARPDQGGTFRLDVPPGEYFVAAVDRLTSTSEDWLGTLVPSATRFTIEGAPVQAELRLVRLSR